MGGGDCDLACVAIHTVTGYALGKALDRGAFLPPREETRDDTISGLELVNPCADSFHDARTVCHRDAFVRIGNLARYHEIIMKIQGAGVKSNADFALARLARIVALNDL